MQQIYRKCENLIFDGKNCFRLKTFNWFRTPTVHARWGTTPMGRVFAHKHDGIVLQRQQNAVRRTCLFHKLSSAELNYTLDIKGLAANVRSFVLPATFDPSWCSRILSLGHCTAVLHRPAVVTMWVILQKNTSWNARIGWQSLGGDYTIVDSDAGILPACNIMFQKKKK